MGNNPPATATYTFSALAVPVATGMCIGVLTEESTALSVIDLSGATPVKTDYTAPVQVGLVAISGASGSPWVVGGGAGVLFDGASITGSPRYFGFGRAWSVAGGTGHFAIATASGTILYFNSSTLAQEGTIAFAAQKIVMSADGSLLVAQGASFSNVWTVGVYSLPAGIQQYAWPYTPATTSQYIVLSASGTVLGQDVLTAGAYTQQASAPTGGSDRRRVFPAG